jgi:transglutaminase-like putative cysteine protease
MRLRIRHQSSFLYASPARGALQNLRLTPRQCDSQNILSWRIDVDRECRLSSGEDAFGNMLHCFSADGPFESLTTMVEGEVETFDTSGVVRGAIERFPPTLYLRETPLTRPSDSLRAFAREITSKRSDALARLHELLAAIFAVMTFDADATHAGTDAAEAFQQKCGVCQDFAHIFIACARAQGIPARFVSGYLWRADGRDEQTAGHAWAESYVEGLGWVGFDPTHGLSPDEAYVRVAVGLDYLGAAPTRGARFGGGDEALNVNVRVGAAQARAPVQSQAQS